uniref:Uncharacterized protein n=1 Tax=Arundo donax TaxID=35708 RepID=A0A0A9FPN0_ARUDO
MVAFHASLMNLCASVLSLSFLLSAK